MQYWRVRASAIPDPKIRTDALQALASKRDNIEGASLFSVLPKRRHARLLRLLVAYQVAWDFLDSLSEHQIGADRANGRHLHRALVEALDPDAPLSDYYRYHPWQDDGGYLVALVVTCRTICAELPSYKEVCATVLPAVERCAIQSINHEPNPQTRSVELKQWVEQEFGSEPTLTWFEMAAAAGAFMPHVLLALAAEPTCERAAVQAVYSTYFPWVSLVISMLDSYVDLAADEVSGDHSYMSYYGDREIAIERLAAIIARIARDAHGLPDSARHALVTEGIVAMYLSTREANTGEARRTTRSLAAASGPLTETLLLLARMWRYTRVRLPLVTAAGERRLPGLPLPAPLLTYIYWRWPFAYMKCCQAAYGKVFEHRMTSFPRLVFLSDHTEVKAVLSAPADILHPGEGGATIAPIVGSRSFMLLDEEEHLRGRRAVLPAFRKDALDPESEWLEQTVRREVATWPRDVPIRLHPRLRALTLQVILRRIFGGRAPEERLAILHERVLAMLAVTGSVVFPVPALRLGPGRYIWHRFLGDRALVDETIRRLIDERLESYSSSRGEDALATLLAAKQPDGSPLSRSQLRDNVMSLILAGHETTASQLSWAFQLLAHNPRVQRRLIDEINDEEAGEEYLNATIQEVLRHRPVFLFAIPREVKRPIEIGGHRYEPPVHLLACIYLLHHDPEVYPDPERFRPERFMEGQPSPHAWLPWGGGRKRCPGSRLAILEMRAVLRATLESVTVAPASQRIERARWRSVIVTPHRGSRVVLCSRERAGVRRRRGDGLQARCPVAHTWPLGQQT